ncbi:hypothetical protein [Pseudomonas sp. CDFA 610]|uniref:hypothetical protein n=1 Tax=Pseudomonas sp. CDFA 610 TaxID=2829825 RepID=UPI001E2F3995|nr:hypothetical protein [Pseudomonas sp. CDFA 610]MCD5981322.1 hypothetical protein [Pseudomonas sp. CDFA 610]
MSNSVRPGYSKLTITASLHVQPDPDVTKTVHPPPKKKKKTSEFLYKTFTTTAIDQPVKTAKISGITPTPRNLLNKKSTHNFKNLI